MARGNTPGLGTFLQALRGRSVSLLRGDPDGCSVNLRCLDDFHSLQEAFALEDFDGAHREQPIDSIRERGVLRMELTAVQLVCRLGQTDRSKPQARWRRAELGEKTRSGVNVGAGPTSELHDAEELPLDTPCCDLHPPASVSRLRQ